MQIHRLLYRSDAILSGSTESVEHQVAAIVDGSKRANGAAGLTGALLLSGGEFIQVLEGPVEAVEATFERICRDLRHRRVRLLELAVADDRVFAEWAMVRIQPANEIVRLCPGLDMSGQSRLDGHAAGATIRMMRTVLLTNASTAGRGMARRA